MKHKTKTRAVAAAAVGLNVMEAVVDTVADTSTVTKAPTVVATASLVGYLARPRPADNDEGQQG